MLQQAHAKINLTLNVVGRKENGYHELDMIMLPLELHDDIHIDLAQEDQFTSDDPLVKMDEHNTVVKAALLMKKTYALDTGFCVHLHKRIPSQAGMAGGSADAAAVMRGINALCDLQIPTLELAQLGKQVGADVPFCILDQSARVQGIGEVLTPFACDWQPHVLLIKPNIGVSTKEGFQTLDFKHCPHPDAGIVQTLLEEKRYDEIPSHIDNSLEYSAFRLVPVIQDIKLDLIQRGFDCVLMSGSGSTVFAITEDQTLVDNAIKAYQDTDYFVMETTFYKG